MQAAADREVEAGVESSGVTESDAAVTWHTPAEVARRLGLRYPTVLLYAKELGDRRQLSKK
jgi:hypothetical protein